MKVEITEKGLHDAKGEPVAVGTIITIKGDEMPASMLNKCRVMAEPGKGKVAVTNPAEGALPGPDDTQPGGAS